MLGVETITENDRFCCYNAVSLIWKHCKDTLMDILKILYKQWEVGKGGKMIVCICSFG